MHGASPVVLYKIVFAIKLNFEFFLQLGSSKAVNGNSHKEPDEELDSDKLPCPFPMWERHKNFPVLSESLEIAYNDKVIPTEHQLPKNI